VSGAHSFQKQRWLFGVRWVAEQIDRATLRTTLAYRFTPEFSAGIEYNPLANDVGPLANWVPLSETEQRPAVILGTSSDRIGTPHGRSFYATASKNLESLSGLPISPYAGVVYGTYESRFRPIAGMTTDFGKGFSNLTMFDGVNIHTMITFEYQRHSFSVLLVRLRDFGFSYSIRF
jgi:hypothetical protein